jgi:hypothetical protein
MSIKLKGSTAGSVALDAPANTSPSGSDISFTLPIADGSSGQVLTTNGSGALSFANEGKILQVVQTEKGDTFSFAPSSTPEFGTVMSATITPSSTSSKILVIYTMNARSSSTNAGHGTRVLRGSTAIGIGDTNGSRTRMGMGSFFNSSDYRNRCIAQIILDSPSTTSATTYNLQIGGETGGTYYVNSGEGNSAAYNQACTHLTLLEVAG